ncbi:MAG: hypothetical protein ABI594_15170 [Ginsengibacter sp.]
MQSKTEGKPVYRYFYERPRPALRSETSNAIEEIRPPTTGAAHSSEIEYAMGNLPTNHVYSWQAEDLKFQQSCNN